MPLAYRPRSILGLEAKLGNPGHCGLIRVTSQWHPGQVGSQVAYTDPVLSLKHSIYVTLYAVFEM